LNFTVAPGEVVALVGPSGVGKSSLLRLLGGVDRRYGGSIGIDGVEAAGVPAPGMMFQDPRLLPWRTVHDNLRLASAGLSVIRTEQILESVGLSGCGPLLPGQLSLGMQRRVAFARAIAVPRHLLVLDEPFASLDADRTAQLRHLLAGELSRHNSTLVFATHDIADAVWLADRIFHLAGRPALLTELKLDLPRSRRDASLVGALAARLRADIQATNG
jgi:ABC-type nitrate/sulfonate/bicarbonate transport system ATPase subunit